MVDQPLGLAPAREAFDKAGYAAKPLTFWDALANSGIQTTGHHLHAELGEQGLQEPLKALVI